MNVLADRSVVIRRTVTVSSRMDLTAYRSRMEAHARRLGETWESAEEIANTALLRAERCDIDREPLNLLLRIVVRLVLDARRTRKSRVKLVPWDSGLRDGATRDDTVAAPEAGDDSPVSDEARRMFSALVKGLPDNQRTVIALHCEGVPHREISERVGIPIGTVRSRISKAKATMTRMVRSIRDLAA